MAKRGPKRRPGPDRGPFAEADWKAPEYLSPRARKEFERVYQLLQESGRDELTDPRLVEAYAVNYDMLLLSYSDVLRDGTTVESDRGNKSRHPAVDGVNSITMRLRGIINDLGFSPRSVRGATEVAPSSPTTKDDGSPDGWGGLLKLAE